MKLLSLSKLFIVYLLLTLLSGQVSGQYDYWSNAVTFTDSLTDNINPVVSFVTFPEDGFYVFWEKSADETSTAIYAQDFYGENSEPLLVLSGEGVHYTRPQPVNTKKYGSQDTLFYLFYESDEAGYKNIYYRIYNESGFTAPQPLTESTAEKTNLICNNYGSIVWMEQNRIMHMKLNTYYHTFDTPVVIDSGNCQSLSLVQEMFIDYPEVAWIKEINDSSRIMVRKYSSWDSSWLEPQVIFTAPQCLNLSLSPGFGMQDVLIWDSFDGTSWRIFYYSLITGETYQSEFDAPRPFYPFFYSGYIPVSNRWFEAGFTSIIYYDANSYSVYNSPYYVEAPLDQYQNVSGPADTLQHSQIFTGKMVGCYQYLINIWEQRVNDHWQLKYSETSLCLSDIEENEMSDMGLKISPNPVSGRTTVSFLLKAPAEVNLSVWTLSGKQISTIVSGKLDAGQHEFAWDGGLYTPGVYLVKLQSGSTIITKKLILSR
jgi:hypothetical protein